MAWSTCVKCGGTSFEIVETEPSGSNYKLLFVQCSSCGGVIGVLDWYNIGARTFELEKKIDDLTQNLTYAVETLNHNLGIINNNIKLIISSINTKK